METFCNKTKQNNTRQLGGSVNTFPFSHGFICIKMLFFLLQQGTRQVFKVLANVKRVYWSQAKDDIFRSLKTLFLIQLQFSLSLHTTIIYANLWAPLAHRCNGPSSRRIVDIGIKRKKWVGVRKRGRDDLTWSLRIETMRCDNGSQCMNTPRKSVLRV